MRILIADDERPICDWLHFTISSLKKPYEIVATATNGTEAARLYKELLPDVVLTDINMPGMNGLEFLHTIGGFDHPCFIAVLSNHDNFSYAREAFSSRAQKYILKTELDRQCLSDLLSEAEDYLKTAAAPRAPTTRTFQLDLLVKSILQGQSVDRAQILEVFRAPENHMDESYFFAISARLRAPLALGRAIELPEMEHISNARVICADDYTLIFLANIAPVPSILFQTSTVFSFASKLSKLYDASIGVSSVYPSLSELPRAIHQSLTALDSGFFSNSIATQFSNDLHSVRSLPSSQVSALLTAVRSRRRSETLEQLHLLFQAIRSAPGVSRKQLIHMCKIIDYSLLVAHYQENFSAITQEHERFCNSLQSVADLSQLELLLSEACRALLPDDEENAAYSYHIVRTVRYLQEHFSEQITLQDLATLTQLSPEYFCRLFKSETGVTFNQYLTRLRMEHAIALLTHGSRKIKEVAAQCGYISVSYFTKLFKDYTGRTPADFMKRS